MRRLKFEIDDELKEDIPIIKVTTIEQAFNRMDNYEFKFVYVIINSKLFPLFIQRYESEIKKLVSMFQNQDEDFWINQQELVFNELAENDIRCITALQLIKELKLKPHFAEQIKEMAIVSEVKDREQNKSAKGRILDI